MDVFYPLGIGSQLSNFELKMSLRSVEKHLSNYGDVWIVGEKPDWIQHVNHIQFPDLNGIPDFNIMKKTEQALWQVDRLLFFNDDHYLLDSFDAEQFPYFYHDTLEYFVKKRGLDFYGKRANNTLKHLKRQELPTKFFDIHTPIIYERAPFFENVLSLPWELSKEGFVLKSAYANALKIEGTEQKDSKSRFPPFVPVNVFSSTSKPTKNVQKFLTDMFPKKSKYEK